MLKYFELSKSVCLKERNDIRVKTDLRGLLSAKKDAHQCWIELGDNDLMISSAT